MPGVRPSKKRKADPSGDPTGPGGQAKKAAHQPPPESHNLLAAHELIIAELSPKYDVLAASVISSTQIRKRVTYATGHLLGGGSPGPKPAVVLLHARPADVCKLITVVEQCKRVLGAEGKPCFQYNQLFELPEAAVKRDVVEKTILEGADGNGDNGDDGDSEDDDDFEVMESRLEKALLPQPTTQVVKSMRIFLSVAAIPELKTRSGVTLQTDRKES